MDLRSVNFQTINQYAQWISFFFFFVAALLHIAFFVLESILFKDPKVHRRFGVHTKEQFEAIQPWAFNQGFYNLFIAIGTFWGLRLIFKGQIVAAGAMVSFCGLSMVGAGLVLFFTKKSMRRAAWIQMGPPLLGFFFLSFHIMARLSSIH
jgi:putative membrane protein